MVKRNHNRHHKDYHHKDHHHKDHHHQTDGLGFGAMARQVLLLALVTCLIGISNLWGLSLEKTRALAPADREETKREGTRKVEKIRVPEKEERILPGDKLCIRLEEDKDYGGIVTVSSTGYIGLPLLNEIKVTDFVPSALAGIIKDTLERKYFQKATVTVLSYDQNRASEPPAADRWVDNGGAGIDQGIKQKAEKIYIVGEVSHPGVITIPEDEVFTVGKAIIIAGGFTEFAKEKKVKLVRLKGKGKGNGNGNGNGKREVRIIDAVKIIKEGHLEEDVEVKDGDWIIVSQSLFKF